MTDTIDFKNVLRTCLRDFPHISSLKKEQETCLECLASGSDVFAILPTGYGKSLIFELFPRVMKLMKQRDGICTVIVISPLVSIMKDQVQHVRSMGISAAAIGIDEEDDGSERMIVSGECEIVFASPESWLSEKWTKELKEGKLGERRAPPLACEQRDFFACGETPVGELGGLFSEELRSLSDAVSFLNVP